VVLLVALASPVFADWELGMSWTPLTSTDVTATGNTTKLDSMPGFHIAYSWFILYGSWDALAVPNFMVEGMTSYYDPVNGYSPGFYVPGFVNLFDAGIRLVIAPFTAYAEVGTNTLYIYQVGMAPGGIGANLRIGAGLYFDWWGVSISGTSLFASFADLQSTLKQLGSDNTRQTAVNSIEKSLIPSVELKLYLK
jgi:hypothetical protein